MTAWINFMMDAGPSEGLKAAWQFLQSVAQYFRDAITIDLKVAKLYQIAYEFEVDQKDYENKVQGEESLTIKEEALNKTMSDINRIVNGLYEQLTQVKKSNQQLLISLKSVAASMNQRNKRRSTHQQVEKVRQHFSVFRSKYEQWLKHPTVTNGKGLVTKDILTNVDQLNDPFFSTKIKDGLKGLINNLYETTKGSNANPKKLTIKKPRDLINFQLPPLAGDEFLHGDSMAVERFVTAIEHDVNIYSTEFIFTINDESVDVRAARILWHFHQILDIYQDGKEKFSMMGTEVFLLAKRMEDSRIKEWDNLHNDLTNNMPKFISRCMKILLAVRRDELCRKKEIKNLLFSEDFCTVETKLSDVDMLFKKMFYQFRDDPYELLRDILNAADQIKTVENQRNSNSSPLRQVEPEVPLVEPELRQVAKYLKRVGISPIKLKADETSLDEYKDALNKLLLINSSLLPKLTAYFWKEIIIGNIPEIINDIKLGNNFLIMQMHLKELRNVEMNSKQYRTHFHEKLLSVILTEQGEKGIVQNGGGIGKEKKVLL